MEFLLILFPYWNNEKGNKLTFLPSWKLESLVLPQRCRFMILDRQKWGGSHLLMLSCWQVTFLRQVSLWCTFQCLVKTSQIRGSWVRAAEAGVIAFPDRSYSGYHLEFSNPAYVSDFYSSISFNDFVSIYFPILDHLPLDKPRVVSFSCIAYWYIHILFQPLQDGFNIVLMTQVARFSR